MVQQICCNSFAKDVFVKLIICFERKRFQIDVMCLNFIDIHFL